MLSGATLSESHSSRTGNSTSQYTGSNHTHISFLVTAFRTPKFHPQLIRKFFVSPKLSIPVLLNLTNLIPPVNLTFLVRKRNRIVAVNSPWRRR
jgi:hypothetical protein